MQGGKIMSKYQSIVIKKAMCKIAANKFLLPAIQRKFVWSTYQIEMLFDSLLRGYPINSFMLWQIRDEKIKKEYKFYTFIRDYIQKFGEENPDAPSGLLLNDFYAVIDGQQRLTSLYIGLSGSYTTKKPNKHWQKDRSETPMIERKLYLELSQALPSNIDNDKMYNFRFLSDDELKKDSNDNPNHFWFKVGDVLSFEKEADVNSFLIKHPTLFNNNFAMETLFNLFERINKDESINYYLVDDQDQDKVLEVFIRTNSGGTPLSFSDLLMSISSANWQKYDAREEMRSVRESIRAFGNPCFEVSQDFILKSILVLSDVDVKFKIQNFNRTNITKFENNWEDIKKSLIATFNLLKQLNFNDRLLRAKNAAIPIAYYIYKKKLFDVITKTTYDRTDKKNISKWLIMSLLKGIFSGTSDNVLSTVRNVISSSNTKSFPFKEIVEKFKTNADKNYTFDDDVISSFLEYECGSEGCGLILNLLYPDVIIEHGNNIAQDHMHPKAAFSKERLRAYDTSLGSHDKIKFETDKQYYIDPKYWNSVLNLQLLESSLNESKSDQSLSDWANRYCKKNSDLLLSDNTSLDFLCFKEFIEDRRIMITKKIKNILND